MKRALLLIALLLSACVTVVPPDSDQPVRIFYARPLVTEEWYREIHAEMEKCSGHEQPYDFLEWYVIQPGGLGRTETGENAGLWSGPNRVYLDARFVLDEGVLRHELLHYLMQLGDPAHDDPVFRACALL